MKKLAIIIILSLFALPLLAFTEESAFVATADHTYFCNEISMGFASTIVKNADGSYLKIPNSEVKAFRLNGRQYEKMPLVSNAGDTVTYTFMEFICSKDGYRLYRYCTNCNHYDPLNGEIAPINHIYRYYVLVDGKIRLLNCADSLKKAMSFFKVKVFC